MKAILLRSGSSSIPSSLLHGSSKELFFDQDHGAGISFPGKNSLHSPRSALHFDIKAKKQTPTIFRRSLSDTDLIRSKMRTSPSQFRSLSRISVPSSSGRIEEEGDVTGRTADLQLEACKDAGHLSLKKNGFDVGVSDRVAEMFHGNEVFAEELEFSGGGMGKGRKVGGGNGGRSGGDGSGHFAEGNADQNKLGAYYKQMLQANPSDPLLLRNYGNFLHEVEKDYARAEEYYGRAILASPEDGEILSLYGKLIWETQKDQERAQGYFDQAIKACPDDCYVLGSYAHFLWDADEEEEEIQVDTKAKTPPLVEAR